MNKVRGSTGVALSGEVWVLVSELLYRLRKLLLGWEVVAHGPP